MATEYVEYNGQYSGEQIDSAIAKVGNLKTVATSGSYNDLTNKPTIPDAANNATLTIKKNGTAVGTFTADADTNVDINITVPTTASDVSALPASTKYAGASTAGGAATSASKLTVNAGSSTNPVYFTSGLPTPCTYNLEKSVPSNAVFTDTTYESKSAASGGTAVSLVTTGEKYTWNNKQSAISDLSTIRSGAALGATAVQPETGKGLSTNDYTTAEKEKLAGLTQYTNAMAVATNYGVGTAVTSNSNINDYTEPGVYQCSGPAIAQTVSNTPTTQPFRLEVKTFASSTSLIQEITAVDNTTSGEPVIFRRVKLASGWKPWYKFTGTAVT